KKAFFHIRISGVDLGPAPQRLSSHSRFDCQHPSLVGICSDREVSVCLASSAMVVHLGRWWLKHNFILFNVVCLLVVCFCERITGKQHDLPAKYVDGSTDS